MFIGVFFIAIYFVILILFIIIIIIIIIIIKPSYLDTRRDLLLFCLRLNNKRKTYESISNDHVRHRLVDDNNDNDNDSDNNDE